MWISVFACFIYTCFLYSIYLLITECPTPSCFSFFLSFCWTASPTLPSAAACWIYLHTLLDLFCCCSVRSPKGFCVCFCILVICALQLCCGCSLGRKKERNAWTRIRLDWQGHWGIFRPHFFSFFCLFLERHASMTPLLWNAFCSFSVWGSSCLEELSLGGDKYLVIPPSGCAEMTCLTGSF